MALIALSVALLLLVCIPEAAMETRRLMSAPVAPPDARWRDVTYLPDQLPPRDTALVSALVTLSRAMSHGHPQLHVSPIMVTVGKLLEYAALRSLWSFANDQPTVFVAEQPKHSNKWSEHSACEASSAWHCLYGHGDAHHGHDGKFNRHDVERAAEVMQWRTEEHQLIHLGTLATALAPDIHHVPAYIKHDVNVESETDLNISLHGRFADACDYQANEARPYGEEQWSDPRGRPCFPFDAYRRELEAISAKYNTKNVLLATDSREFLHYMLQDKRFNYAYVDFDRSLYERGTGWAHWVQNRNDVTPEMVDSSLTALHLLRHGHVLIGGLYSHYTRALFFAMVGQLGYVPAFRSLDGGGPIWSKWNDTDFVGAVLRGADPGVQWPQGGNRRTLLNRR